MNQQTQEPAVTATISQCDAQAEDESLLTFNAQYRHGDSETLVRELEQRARSLRAMLACANADLCEANYFLESDRALNVVGGAQYLVDEMLAIFEGLEALQLKAARDHRSSDR